MASDSYTNIVIANAVANSSRLQPKQIGSIATLLNMQNVKY